MNDLTAKADQQRLRLEAVKREYTLMQQNDYWYLLLFFIQLKWSLVLLIIA